MDTGAWYFFIVNLTKVPIYASLGMINERTLRFNLMVAPLVVLGAFLGRWILNRIHPDLFRILILVLTAIAAIRLLF